MRKYTKYKDCGIQWLGQIPEHWKILPIKYCADLFTGNSISDKDKENYLDSTDAIPYIATKDINAQTLLADYENGMYTKKEDASFKIASKGSTLLCIEGGSAGRKKTYLTKDVSFVNKLCCFTAKENMSGKYMYYYINSNEFVEIFNYHITGLIGGVSLSSLVNFKFPLPPLSEQQAIVEFLDKKTGKIDQSISILEAQEKDLQAYRKAIITETVTKGLNPNAPMKDSGIQWIGGIPETWKVDKLKLLFILHRGYDLANSNFVDGGVPVYGSGGFMGYHNEIKVLAPNIVIGRSGSVGKLHYITEDFWAHNTGIYISDTKENNVKYLYYILSSFDVSALATKTAVPTLDRKKIQEKVFPYTTNIIEQQAIVEYLDKKTSDIDTAIQKINTQIADLQAYRTALISEAVTGKIDVR